MAQRVDRWSFTAHDSLVSQTTPNGSPPDRWGIHWNFQTLELLKKSNDLSSNRQLAQAVGVPYRTLHRQIETDSPQIDSVAAIAGRFGVHLNAVIQLVREAA